jgi:hypothetical protein
LRSKDYGLWSKGKEEHVIASRKSITNSTIQQINQSTWLKALFSPPQFIVAVILLSATLGMSHGVDFSEKIPINQPFYKFPLQVGEWIGTKYGMEEKFIDKLDFSDYVIVDYHNKASKKVNFYVAFYESQCMGESIHSPATCLPGSG